LRPRGYLPRGFRGQTLRRPLEVALVPPVRISTMFGSSMHPGRLRCSSVTYVKYAPSSRLADRAPRRPKHGRSSDGRN
jgi:hypothetical protein